LLNGGAHRERTHRSDASASTAKPHRGFVNLDRCRVDPFGQRERSLASLAFSVDNSGCFGVQLFFDPAESGSEQSEDEGSECEPSAASEQPCTHSTTIGRAL
jgi:hypothetical protein